MNKIRNQRSNLPVKSWHSILPGDRRAAGLKNTRIGDACSRKHNPSCLCEKEQAKKLGESIIPTKQSPGQVLGNHSARRSLRWGLKDKRIGDTRSR